MAAAARCALRRAARWQLWVRPAPASRPIAAVAAAPGLQPALRSGALAAAARPPRPRLEGRRAYVDSVDRTITVRSMEDPLEVLTFMDAHGDSDARTYEAALRQLGRLATGESYQEVVGDGRFHAILSNLAGRLDDCDARALSMIADASARFRTSTPELMDLAQRLAEVVCRREGAFSPRTLAPIAIALAVRGVRDVATVEFIKTEAIKVMDDLEPVQCTTLLEAFRRWGIFDRQLVDLVVERMSDEVDRFTSRDVVNALAVVSRLGLPRGFLLRRLCTLSFENLGQFTPRELAKMSYSLAKLRFLTQGNVDDLADALSPDLSRLVGSQISEFLFALGMTDARHQLDLARKLIAHYTSAASKTPSKSTGSLVDFMWALCAVELVDEFRDEFKAAAEQVLERQPPQNRVLLMKFFDVICCLELELQGLGIAVPRTWRAACEDADRFEMDRLESSRLHGEVLMRFDQLRGKTKGMRWQLRMQRNQPCGPYRVDMLDEESKIALDMETVSWPTARHLKHRLLAGLGFKPLRLEYWDWRRARTEEDQNTYLEREVTRVLQPAL